MGLIMPNPEMKQQINSRTKSEASAYTVDIPSEFGLETKFYRHESLSLPRLKYLIATLFNLS
jgi:hypothetical protein